MMLVSYWSIYFHALTQFMKLISYWSISFHSLTHFLSYSLTIYRWSSFEEYLVCLKQQCASSNTSSSIQNHPQLVGDDRYKVKHFQPGLLRHVVGDTLRVVRDPVGVVGVSLCLVGDTLVWILKSATTWLNKVLST